jgi:ribosome biogenesis protein MAK21
MKKNKNRSSADKPSASAEVDIASEALERLADKLKVDLAKPAQQQSKQKSTPVSADAKARRKSDGSGEKIVKQNEPGKSKDNGPSKKNGIAKNQADKNAIKSKETEKIPASKPAKNTDGPKRPDNKRQKVADTQSEKPLPVKGAATSQLASTKKKKGEKKGEKSNGKGNIEKDPLFEEIIALGGTKEDLELLQGIDSDEDVEGDSSPAQKPQQAGNSKSVNALEMASLMI